ncbi:geranylgeranylglyceryl/heptaprenylglyceryl phosphate synthase [soil metagenome]
MGIYSRICENKLNGRKQLAVLVDPDKTTSSSLDLLCHLCMDHHVDFIFVGGSLLTNGDLGATIKGIRERCSIPVMIFPGSHQQIDANADAILLLSLISGRNADLLIGQHVMAAPRLRASGLEIIPTGYVLIDGGNMTTVQYVSGTPPIPVNKPEIAACTALAGEQLGMKLIFAEAGSGATNAVSPEMIRAIKNEIQIPLIVGGGIKTAEQAKESFDAGADLIVIGNILEKDPTLIADIAKSR